MKRIKNPVVWQNKNGKFFMEINTEMNVENKRMKKMKNKIQKFLEEWSIKFTSTSPKGEIYIFRFTFEGEKYVSYVKKTGSANLYNVSSKKRIIKATKDWECFLSDIKKELNVTQ